MNFGVRSQIDFFISRYYLPFYHNKGFNLLFIRFYYILHFMAQVNYKFFSEFIVPKTPNYLSFYVNELSQVKDYLRICLPKYMYITQVERFSTIF